MRNVPVSFPVERFDQEKNRRVVFPTLTLSCVFEKISRLLQLYTGMADSKNKPMKHDQENTNENEPT